MHAEFINLALPERMQFLRMRGLCHGCLRWGHLCKDCQVKESCAACSGLYTTLLHNNSLTKDKQDTNGKIPEATSHRIEVSDSKKRAECYSHSLIIPVWLRHKQDPQVQLKLSTVLAEEVVMCKKQLECTRP